jgi:hypothetical protein
MKRSGNHALINWIMAQSSFHLVNNFIPVGPMLRDNLPMPAPLDLPGWMEYILHSRQEPIVPTDTFSGIYVTVEDHLPDIRIFQNTEGIPITNLLVVRNARNLFSSRIRKAAKTDNHSFMIDIPFIRQRTMEVWKAQCRWYLALEETYAPRIAVHFDTWFSDLSYRKKISEILGLSFSDLGLQNVSQEGGGSSFDGSTFDGNATEMKVLAREAMLNASEKELLDSIFEDDECRELDQLIRDSDPYELLLNRNDTSR